MNPQSMDEWKWYIVNKNNLTCVELYIIVRVVENFEYAWTYHEDQWLLSDYAWLLK